MNPGQKSYVFSPDWQMLTVKIAVDGVHLITLLTLPQAHAFEGQRINLAF